MPNPKRRHSKRRKNNRRAHDYLTARALAECPNCHEPKLAHRVCQHCGYYYSHGGRGREIVEVVAE